MIQIRRNTFETNSSSSHSLVIMTDNIIKENGEDLYFTHDEMLESLHRVSRGTYKPWNDNWYFGRAPFRVLDTFEWKLQYTYANCGEDEDKIKEVTDIFNKSVTSKPFFNDHSFILPSELVVIIISFLSFFWV